MDHKFVIDPETLECPLCNEVLCPPVHQCCNGHVACATCCAKLLGSGCPFCRAKPMAHSRCLAVEKILKSLWITCLYALQGCKETLQFSKKEEHKKKFCKYRPIQCPVGKCKHVGTKVCGGSSVFTLEALALDNQEMEEIGQKSEFLLVLNVKGGRIRQFHLELSLL